MSSKLNKIQNRNSSYLTSKLLLFSISAILLIIVLYLVNKRFNKNINNLLVNPLVSLFSPRENFAIGEIENSTYRPYGSSKIPSNISNYGFYNIVINNENLLSTGDVGTSDIDVIPERNDDNDISTIFFIVKINNISSKFEYKYYIIPISYGLPLIKSPPEQNFLRINNEEITLNKDTVSTKPYVLDIRKEDDIHYIKSSSLALNLISDSNVVTNETTNKLKFTKFIKSDSQKIKLNDKNNLNYYSYDNGYYRLSIEKDNFTKQFLVRVERVENETQTYHLLNIGELKDERYNDFTQKNSILSLNSELSSNGDYKGKTSLNSKFIVQPLTGNLDKCLITNKDVLNFYINHTGRIKEVKGNIGLIDGYYLISYTLGSETYLLTFDNNQIKIVKTNKDLNTNEINEVINSSDGNNIFEVKNISKFYHTLKVIRNAKFLTVESKEKTLEIKFNIKENSRGNGFAIFKEHNDDFTISVQMSEIKNDNSNIKIGGLLSYLHILGDSLETMNTEKDSNSTKFNFHLIATLDNKLYNITSSTTCTFRSRFDKIETNNTEIFLPVDDENNLFKESQLKNKKLMEQCISVNPNIKYNPTYLDKNGIFNKLDSKYDTQPNDFRTIDSNKLSSGSKLIKDVTAMNCRSECDINENCKEFLHQLNRVGSNSLNNRYNGNCILLDHTDVANTFKWNNGNNGIAYSSYSKIENQESILSIPEEPITTFPAVLISKDDSCKHNINTCEDKNYCKKMGNKCLRKCNIDLATGISDGLSSSDIDMRCIGTLNDFNIRFSEVERNLGEEIIQKSVLIKATAEFKNKSKLLHHPILKLQGGFKVMFRCLGDSAKSSTEFVEIIDYKYDHDNHQENEFRISNTGTNLNIPLPNTITQCVKQGNNFVLSVQIVDIHGITNVHPIAPIESNNEQQEKIRLAIQEGVFNEVINNFNSLNLKINQILNNFNLT